MAHNNGYGHYDPRYDPRYQQQYAYPRQPNVEVRVPMMGNPYNLQPQYQVPAPPPLQPQPPIQSPVLPQVQHQLPQHNYQQIQANHGYQQQPYSPYMQRPSPQMQIQSPQMQVQVPHYQQHQLQQHQQLQQTPSPRMSSNGYPSPMPRPPSAKVKPRPAPKPSPKIQAPPPVPVPMAKPSPVQAPAPKPKMKAKLPPVQAPPPAASPKPPTPQFDHSIILVDLAEEYFGAAYGTEEHAGRIEDQEIFCKLISTGLGCLEAALRERKSSLQPSVEAALRFRYSSILYQETENHMEAEECLVKGITLCERYRLHDIMYNMQHLHARITYSQNPRAGVKLLDGMIKNVEAVQHVPWIYAMRFLRVHLALKMSQTQETLTALSNLKVIANMANSRGDHAVSVLASSLEALVHLNRAMSVDGIEQAQRALAAARSSQLDPQAQKVPQLSIISFFVDLCCSMHQGDANQGSTKLSAMQTFMDERPNDPGWTDDGVFSVPLSQATAQTLRNPGDSKGVVTCDADSNVSIQVQWLPKEELYTLGYALSASTLMNKNAQDGQKAERFLQESLKVLEKSSPSNVQRREKAHATLRCHLQAQVTFAYCLRNAWASARQEYTKLQTMAGSLPADSSSKFEMILQFLQASIYQGTGDLESALSIYGRPIFTLGSKTANVASPFQQNLCILAALNSLLIVSDPAHPAHYQCSSILQAVEPLAMDSPSKNIQAAFHLIRAISANVNTTEPSSILKTKQNIQNALAAAKASANNQLCCITLNFMSWKFFRGVVGEQPKKSALSGQNLARKGQSDLWLSVADGLLAEVLETQGMSQEAEKARKEGREIAEKLPTAMQRHVEGRVLDGTFLT